MKAYERLLKYVVVRTPSDENSDTVPSSTCQFDLARILETEMKELGLVDVYLDDQCYLYGKLPATAGYEDKPKIGFIAHMDTVSDFCDHDITPVITENYDGQDLKLGDSGLVLSVQNFPHLTSLKGRTLITTDGTTVLGAGDKAITMNKRKGPSHVSAIALNINTDRFISRIILQLQQLRQLSDPYLRL